MSTPTDPPLTGGSTQPGRTGWPGASMRVSDADRAAAADRLSRHYGDGRLDKAEFDLRLDRAMRATTRADLIGLVSDLPEGPPPAADSNPSAGRGQRRLQRQLLQAQLERERLLLKHERRESRQQERELRRHTIRQLPAILALVVVVIVAGTVLRHIYSIWLVLAVLAFLWIRYSQRDRSNS
jgi:Domain of unknown function (DUF1707)